MRKKVVIMQKDEIYCDCDVIHAEVVDSVKDKMRMKTNYTDWLTFLKFWVTILA